ncbi:MAG: esterase-like activity of phytase family protein [Cyanobacteria bacterium P01_F01_bin.143]
MNFFRFRLIRPLCCLIILFSVTACSLPPRVMAQDRMFLDLSLEFLDSYELPQTSFEDTIVGGLSAIAYDQVNDLFYVLSDDRSQRGAARYYTMKLNLQERPNNEISINNVTVENVIFLKDQNGNLFAEGTIDPEGLALSPRDTVFISSEGAPELNINPFVAEFDLVTGQQRSLVPVSPRYFPEENQGIRKNLAFESLTIKLVGLPQDPFRLFTAIESSLIQDQSEEENARIRFLHYVINPIGDPIVIAEHLYLLEPDEPETISNGLTELLTLDQEGYFLSLERTFGFLGAGAKIFQVVAGNASDTYTVDSLQDISNVQPMNKQLLLDLKDLGIYLDNLEGMTLGPRLPDGSHSLILVSDNNFSEDQVTQFLLFRLNQ